MNLPTHRERLGQWLNENGLIGSMVEIGVCFGGFSKIVLKDWRGAAYHMIDPWTTQDPRVYREKQDERWVYDKRHEECLAIAASDRRVIVHRAFSSEAAVKFNNASLDCCYIDGNHSYEAVSQDLKDWWPKMKSGGLFCGHDYGNQTEAMGYAGWDCEVQRAVEEWLKKHPELGQPHLTPCSSFWFLKP